MNKMYVVLSTLALTLVGISLVPTASAHVCDSVAGDCGNCNTGLVAVHYHTKSGVFQCSGVGPASTDDILPETQTEHEDGNAFVSWLGHVGDRVASVFGNAFS